jgi:hypothetical protein
LYHVSLDIVTLTIGTRIGRDEVRGTLGAHTFDKHAAATEVRGRRNDCQRPSRG